MCGVGVFATTRSDVCFIGLTVNNRQPSIINHQHQSTNLSRSPPSGVLIASAVVFVGTELMMTLSATHVGSFVAKEMSRVRFALLSVGGGAEKK